jgi:hypothetical protein
MGGNESRCWLVLLLVNIGGFFAMKHNGVDREESWSIMTSLASRLGLGASVISTPSQ